MKHKLINTGDYLLIVDESGSFKKESPYWLNYTNTICPNRDFGNTWMVGLRDIIAHLPLNNSPILEGVDLLPPLEDEVEKLAANNILSENGQLGFILGYNKAKEKYKYTEEDLKECVMYILRDLNAHNEVDKPVNFVWVDSFEKYIQSLQQPKMPVGFKCEVDYVPSTFNTWKKTTTNSQGITQWVGEYIY